MPTDMTTRIKAIQKQIGVPETGIIDNTTCIALQKQGGITTTAVKADAHIKAVQRMVGADDDGVVGPETITKIEAFILPALPKVPSGGSLVVSNKSLDMIVAFEVSSKEQYEKMYQSPIWPGGQSGVTIGIGYDLGYYTGQQIADAWNRFVSVGDLEKLLSVKGKKGADAKSVTVSIKSVKISFANALNVFYQSTLPDFARQVKKTFPGIEKLPPDAQGAMLSLVYNRGSSLTGDRRKEMKNMVPLIAKSKLKEIAGEFRSMKRLWDAKKLPGLIKRREKEAVLVENASFNIVPAEQIIV